MLAINGSAGWVPGFWSRRSNSAGSKDTNKFPTFSENWKPSFHLGRRLSNGERRRKVRYARAATFNGKSGDPGAGPLPDLVRQEATRLASQSYPPGMQIPVRWTKERTSYAHPFAGIALSQSQVESYIRTVGSDRDWLVVSFILAHERAHIDQNKLSSMLGAMTELDRELHADVMAGVY